MMQDNLGSADRQALADQYEIGPEYLCAYLDYWNGSNPENSVESAEDLDRVPSSKRSWIEYALNANLRGKEFLEVFTKYLDPISGRAAVVRCEFGGLVAALKTAGVDAYGFEADSEKVAFARANGRDQGFDDHIFEYHHPTDMPERLGDFDIIIAQNGLEAATDPAAELRGLISRLRPEGRLFITLQNKYSLDLVAADSQSELFGLTLLDPSDQAIYREACGKGKSFSPARRLILPQYLDVIEDAKCSGETIANPLFPSSDPADTRIMVENVISAYRKFLEDTQSQLSLVLQIKLNVLFKKYMAALVQDSVDIHSGLSGPEAFQNKYLSRRWTLLVRRPKP